MAKVHYRPYNQGQVCLFPQDLGELIPADSPVRVVSRILDSLNLEGFHRLYHTGAGRSPYHPRMMLKVVIYAYMNNVYSCRKIEELLRRDVHFMWLSGSQTPDYATVNRFRNRAKTEIDKLFTELVLLLCDEGYVSLDVEYVDGTKIESRANKYTFVWRKRVERDRGRLLEKIKAVLAQVEDCMGREYVERELGTKPGAKLDITPEQLQSLSARLTASLTTPPDGEGERKEPWKTKVKKRKAARELQEHSEKLAEYDRQIETAGERNSYAKTDTDATYMHLKEDALNTGQTKPGYNLQIATENQFIINFGLFPNPTDTLTYIPFLQSFHARYGRYAGTEVADAGYGSEENYRFLEENGAKAYVKYNWYDREHRPRYVPDAFRAENFRYQAEGDYCVCPQERHMPRTGTYHKEHPSGYVSEQAEYTSEDCGGCPLRDRCLRKGETRRVIKRNHRLDAYKKQVSKDLTSEKGKRLMAKRSVEPEAVFGQIKHNMAYRRFRHIGKDKVHMDFAFLAIAFNLKKLLAKGFRGSFFCVFMRHMAPYGVHIPSSGALERIFPEKHHFSPAA